MRAACREVQVLRTLGGDGVAAGRAADRLVRKYVTGRRSACDVVHGLRALLSRNARAAAGELAHSALVAVHPVPTLLWAWTCEHAVLLDVDTVRYMLRLAAVNPRYAKHVRRHRAAVATSPEGLVALLHESHRLPDWAGDAVRDGLAHFGVPALTAAAAPTGPGPAPTPACTA